MAKRQEEQYVFDASAKTVKIPGHVELNGLLAIINVTRDIILYAVGTPGKGATRSHEHLAYGEDADFPYSLDGTCTFTLDFDTATAGHADDDELLIYYEDERKGLTVRPYDAAVDGAERIKISEPQSLIDADFEYGLQETKWQNIGLSRGYASFYEFPGPQETIDSITSDGASPYSNITVTYSATSTGVGTPISVVGLDDSAANSNRAEGLFVPYNETATTVVYKAKGVVDAGNIETPYSKVKVGAAFSSTTIAISTATGTASGTMSVTTTNPHGLFPATPISIVDTNAGAQPYDGRFFISTVTSGTQFDFEIGADATGGISLETSSLYAISDAFFEHRPFDGGVLIGPSLPVCGLDAKRQTKRYFKYQSGKAIQYSTGVLFNPVIDLRTLAYDNVQDEIVITTQTPHGLQKGIGFEIVGVSTAGYNGTYLVKSITDELEFRADRSVAAPATNDDPYLDIQSGGRVFGPPPTVGITTWARAAVRTGMFDDFNGMFWEYDGQNLSVVKRSSTYQLIGSVNTTFESTSITGTNTLFTEQLQVGSRIQIRGGAYNVTGIIDNTNITISPVYRGVTDTNVKITQIIEERVRQEDFNIDKIDGTGPSGYKIKLFGASLLMQMVGIQYSWYGAGTIDYYIRGPLGDWIIAHRISNNNRNIEAYMRSGNLPGRYETTNSSPAVSKLTVATGLTTSVLNLKDASYFPTPSATYPEFVYLTSNQGGTIRNEVMSFTGKTGNQLTGVTTATGYELFLEGTTQTYSAGERSTDGTDLNVSYDHPVDTGVILLSRFAPTISHWGSSVIMDGGFDTDNGFLFSLSRSLTAFDGNATATAIIFRPSPSVSDGLPGQFGEREVVNRSTVQLQSIEISNPSNRNLEIAGVLSPSNIDFDTAWEDANNTTIGSASVFQPSFSQYFEPDVVTPANFFVPENGEILFKFLSTSGVVDFDLTKVKELQNSILGGNNTFPDGPEPLCIVIRNNSGQTADIDIVLRWTEAQA